jgi:hypothetical protein
MHSRSLNRNYADKMLSWQLRHRVPRLQSVLACGPSNGERITICATFHARLAGALPLQANQLMEVGRLREPPCRLNA